MGYSPRGTIRQHAKHLVTMNTNYFKWKEGYDYEGGKYTTSN